MWRLLQNIYWRVFACRSLTAKNKKFNQNYRKKIARLLKKSAECSVNYIKQFYFYNESNTNKTMDTEKLLKEGAVCKQYSNFYNQIGKDFGFKTQEVFIYWNGSNGREGHVFDIWWNKDGWCFLDQTHGSCVNFNK